MRRLFAIFSIFLLLPMMLVVPASAEPVADSVILESYLAPNAMASGGYDQMVYRPRGFVNGVKLDIREVNDAGAYAGYGVLNARHRGDTTLRITLNRKATVGIIWIGGTVPTWLSSWQQAGSVKVDSRDRTVYSKVLDAGEHELGGYTSGIQPYSIIFGEADGSAPVAPAVPSGRETPQPNASCPAWVHDQFVAVAPDGDLYRTWHPQIDKQYWCYFNHEHGSNPEYFMPGYKVFYDNMATGASYAETAMGMVHEGHSGFKSYVFDGADNSRWLITQHFGTGSIGRACKSHHTFDIAIQKNGILQADLHTVGDFGASRSIATNQPLNITACPANADIKLDSARFVPLQTIQDGYEPWRLVEGYTLFGLNTASLTFNTTDPIVICQDEACAPVTIPNVTGSRRLLQTFSTHGDLTLANPQQTGTFFTDPFGKELRDSDDADRVVQFIAKGANITAPLVHGKCWDYDGFGRPYRCATGENSGNGARPSVRESSIGVDN